MQGENGQPVAQCPTNRHGDNKKKSQDDGELIVSFLNWHRQKFESSLVRAPSSLDTQAGSHHKYFLIPLDVLCELLLKIWPVLLECGPLSVLKYLSEVVTPQLFGLLWGEGCGSMWRILGEATLTQNLTSALVTDSFQERLTYLVFQLMEIPATWYRRPWGLTRLVKTTSDILS